MAIGANITKNIGGTAARIALNVAGYLGAGYVINVTIPKILYKNTQGVPPEGTKPIWSPITAIAFTILGAASKNVWVKEFCIGAAVGSWVDTIAEYGLKTPEKRAQFGLSGTSAETLFGRYGVDETGTVEYNPMRYMSGVGASDWQAQPFGHLNGGIGAYGNPSEESVWQGVGRNLGAV